MMGTAAQGDEGPSEVVENTVYVLESEWGLNPGAIAAIAGVCLLLFVALQVRVARKSLQRLEGHVFSDHKRRSREVTLHFLATMSQDSVANRIAISKFAGNDQSISAKEAEAIIRGTDPRFGGDPDDETHGDIRRSIQGYLNGLERIAVGVNLGVLDERVVWQLNGSGIVAAIDRSKEYIEYTQNHKTRDAFVDLIRLGKRMAALEEQFGPVSPTEEPMIGAPPNNAGGAERFLHGLAKRLAKRREDKAA